MGSTLTGASGNLRCSPACTSAASEWLSCTGQSPGGADRPPGANHDPRPASGCEVRVPLGGPSTYTLRPEDAGRYIQFHVEARNIDCGEVQSNGMQECNPSSGHGWSPTVGPVAPAPAPLPPPAPVAVLPLNTDPPVIAGDAEDMETLTVSSGTWTGTAPIAYTYQWLRCSTALRGCQAIAGENETTYTVGRADIGARITVTVTAANLAGARTFTAKLTSRVVPAKPRPGRDVLTIEELLPPQKLVVKSVQAPRVVRSRATLVLRVTITDRRGFLIFGATVGAEDDLGAVAAVQKKTGPRGVAVLRVKLGALSSADRAIVLTITASKPNVPTLTAVKRIRIAVAR